MAASAYMSAKKLVQSRRNLAATQDREMWEEMKKEYHPLKYRFVCRDGTYNFKGDRLTLLAEIREAQPVRIERLA